MTPGQTTCLARFFCIESNERQTFPFLAVRPDLLKKDKSMPLKHFALCGLAVLMMISGGAAVARAGGKNFSAFKGLNLEAITLREDTRFTHSGERPAFAGSLGFRLSPSWRVEGEVNYTTRALDGGDRTSRLALMNLYYDVDIGSKAIKPFVSIGAGVSTHDIGRSGGFSLTRDSNTDLTMQAGGGLNIMLNKNLALSGNYRFLTSAPIGGSTFDADDDSHELRLGVTYKLKAKRNIDPKFGR